MAHAAQKLIPRQSKQVAELIADIQDLMFSSENNPVLITEDMARGRFMKVMNAFHMYEKNVSALNGVLGCYQGSLEPL